MDKAHIIREIQRTAKDNCGVPLGCKRFKTVTGIGFHEWYGRYWVRWTEAVHEAGFKANRKKVAYGESVLLDHLVQLTRRLGRVPVQGDMMIARRADPTFPSLKVYQRLGSKSHRLARLIAYCEANPGNDDVAELWKQVAVTEPPSQRDGAYSEFSAFGYVYLLRHGSRREYKIGRTNNPIRREGEVGIQLPEKLQPVHYIKTDDPAGVECYWHTRFANKRKEGEWFALTASDVQALKRWKRIY